MRTFMAKPEEALPQRKWWVVDAANQPLGRLASRIATILRGKHKVSYTPHVDTGDFVVVINAKQVKVTGRKATDKMYYHHTKHPGGIKGVSFEQVLVKHADLPIQQAVKGMLPHNSLGRKMLGKLKIYSGDKHPHAAQQPAVLEL